MIDATRQQILELLGELSAACPEIRFGQLIANLSYQARGLSNDSVWDMEDAELLLVVRQHLDAWRARRGAEV